jgi:hypothetical protein
MARHGWHWLKGFAGTVLLPNAGTDPRFPIPAGTYVRSSNCDVMTSVTISVLEKPIERIRETCEMMGAADKFEHALGELETYLEEEVASGQTSETRLTYDGLCFLRQAFAKL